MALVPCRGKLRIYVSIGVPNGSIGGRRGMLWEWGLSTITSSEF